MLRGPELHDRATRGEPLSEQEQATLEAWYAEQDRAEAQAFGLPEEMLGQDQDVPDHILPLRRRIQVTLAEISATTRTLQTLTEENESIRQEITSLRARLIQQNPRLAT